jgi:hypothetical protein
MRSERGVSDVIGFVLIFSLVTATVAIVSVSGFAALENVREAEKINNAERGFDVLADNVEDVYDGGVPSRATELSLKGAQIETAPTVTVNVTARNTTTSDNITIERTVRPIVWTEPASDGTELVYSLGAVLRAHPDGGIVVRQPPFRLEPNRSVIRIVETTTDRPQAVGGSNVYLRTTRSSDRVIAVQDPPAFDELRLNITTPRTDIWERHLDSRPGADCSVVTLPGDDTVTCELGTEDGFYVTVTQVSVEIER